MAATPAPYTSGPYLDYQWVSVQPNPDPADFVEFMVIPGGRLYRNTVGAVVTVVFVPD